MLFRSSCDQWKNVPKERQMSLTWNEKTLRVKIRMKMIDKVCLLKEVLSHIKINVHNCDIRYPDNKMPDNKTAIITLVLDIHSHEELECILTGIKKMDECISVYRVND